MESMWNFWNIHQHRPPICPRYLPTAANIQIQGARMRMWFELASGGTARIIVESPGLRPQRCLKHCKTWWTNGLIIKLWPQLPSSVIKKRGWKIPWRTFSTSINTKGMIVEKIHFNPTSSMDFPNRKAPSLGIFQPWGAGSGMKCIGVDRNFAAPRGQMEFLGLGNFDQWNSGTYGKRYEKMVEDVGNDGKRWLNRWEMMGKWWNSWG